MQGLPAARCKTQKTVQKRANSKQFSNLPTVNLMFSVLKFKSILNDPKCTPHKPNVQKAAIKSLDRDRTDVPIFVPNETKR